MNSSISSLPDHRGLYYDYSSNYLFVCDRSSNKIDVFDANLNSIRSISLSSNPYNIAGFEHRLYVGTTDGKVLVVKNYNVISTYVITASSYGINGIYIDKYGYMALSSANGIVYLYHTNGTNMNRSINATAQPYFTYFDSKGRFIINAYNAVTIYY